MKTYHVTYREEFGYDVKAKNPNEAVGEFDRKMRELGVLEGDLWDSYYFVYDENGNEVYQNR